MHKQPPHSSPGLSALMDERDHLSVQISMEGDQPLVDVGRLLELTARLALVERQIQKERKRLTKPIW